MSTATKERPILMSDAMARAVRERRKWQTRRVVLPQPVLIKRAPDLEVFRWVPPGAKEVMPGVWSPSAEWLSHLNPMESGAAGVVDLCPYGRVGDRLWIREAWAETEDEYGTPLVAYRSGGYRILGKRDDGTEVCFEGVAGEYQVERWRPSIFMPRRYCRTVVEITERRLQRLQEISEADAMAEGVDAISLSDVPRRATWTRRHDFFQLWDKLNAARGYGVETNPWVWAITFRRIEA